MVTPQLLLLLLLFRGLASAALALSAASQQQECGGSPYNEPAEPALRCPVVPCANTTQALILALPVLLTLNHPNPQEDQQTVMQPSPGWAMSLQLLDEVKRKVGGVVLMSEEGDVTLKGGACDALNKGTSIPLDALRGGHPLHLGVTAKEGKVRLTHMVGSKSTTVLDLAFSGGLPSWVRVTSATDYGYSALTSTTTTNTTITTTTTTSSNTNTTTTKKTSNKSLKGHDSSFPIWQCVVVAVAAILMVTAGLVLLKCRPRSLPTTTTIPTTAWSRAQTPLSRHDSENSLYCVMQLPQSPRPAAMPRPHGLVP